MSIYNYWNTYDTVKEILNARGIYDEDIIALKTKEIINKSEVDHEVAASADTRQAKGD